MGLQGDRLRDWLGPWAASSSHEQQHPPNHHAIAPYRSTEYALSTMISDTRLNTLAVFAGSLTMFLIVFYHFLSVNAKSAPVEGPKKRQIVAKEALDEE